MKIKNLLLALLAFMIIVPINAQLRKPYRTDTYTLTRLQFPVENPAEKGREMEIVVKRAALLERVAEAIGDAVESDSRLGRLAAAATESGIVQDEAGAISDREVGKGTRTLIPNVFPAEGTYYLEVIVGGEQSWVQDPSLTEILFEPEAYGGNQSTGAKVEYKLYDKKGSGRQLIHSHGPFWVQGRGESDMMAGQEAIDNSRIDLAARWAIQDVLDKYGLRFASVSVPAYRVRGLDRAEDREASDMQDELGELIESFNRQHRSDEYQQRVRENIAFWEKMESQHVRGAERTRDAAVNDENVWSVYSNLAVAHFLAGNRTRATSYIDRAIRLNVISWRETTNRNGEVIGRSRVGIVDTESIANLQIFKNTMDNYFDGIAAMNPAFVNFLADRDARRKASNTAREWGANSYFSMLISDLDVPVEFVSADIGNMQPKQISGTIAKNGSKLADYTVKKTFLFPLTKSYRVKIKTADGTIRTNQKNGAIMLPSSSYDPYFNLVTRFNIDKVKTDTRAKWEGDIRVMYDFDGNIILESQDMIKEKFVYKMFAPTNREDALGFRSMAYRFALEEDSSVKSLDFSLNRIDRDREAGFGAFFGAVWDKMVSNSFYPIETTVLFEDVRSGTINISDNEMIITSDGETSRKNIDKQVDSNGNWSKKTIGDIEISRTIEY